MITDNPELDGTDGAHPAYWRGHDQAVAGLCQRINELLDGKPLSGVCAEPWEATRQRLAALAAANSVLQRLEKNEPLSIGFGKADGAWICGAAIKYQSRSRKAKGDTLTDAINAALDAALDAAGAGE